MVPLYPCYFPVRPTSLTEISKKTKKRLTAPVELLNNSLHSASSTSSVESQEVTYHSQKSRDQQDFSDAEVNDILASLAAVQTPDDLNTSDVEHHFVGGLEIEGKVY